MMFASVNRRFWAIMGLSLLLHVSLFAVVSWQRKQGPASLPPILASIRLINIQESGPTAPASAAPSAQAPAAVPQKARQSSSRVESAAVPRLVHTAGPAVTRVQETGKEAVRETPRESAREVAREAGVPPAVASAEAIRPAAPAESAATARPQGELLAGYRQRLTELLARQQEYPRIAALRGWEGEVRLRLKVARKGNLVAVHLDHSSGFEVLDQHALAMLEALASLPPLPDGLEANEIQVVVPINYKLKKTT